MPALIFGVNIAAPAPLYLFGHLWQLPLLMFSCTIRAKLQMSVPILNYGVSR